MSFLRTWFIAIINPARAFDALKSRPAPRWGLWAVLIRFAGTSLTSGVLGLLLGRKPFEPSYLTFLPTERYYQTQFFFLPLFGLAVWLLMSGVIHVVLRLAAQKSDFDQVLNIVGMGMLVPMPVVWLWDWSMIASNSFQMTVMAVSHSILQLWEAWVEAIGLRRVLGLRALPAAGLSLLANVLYILLAMTLVR